MKLALNHFGLSILATSLLLGGSCAVEGQEPGKADHAPGTPAEAGTEKSSGVAFGGGGYGGGGRVTTGSRYGGGGMGGAGRTMSGYTTRLANVVDTTAASAKPVVVWSGAHEPDRKAQATLEEDLAVMAHLLDKALQEKVGHQTVGGEAMGIGLLFTPGSVPLRSLYLDGYGALFMFNVSFPLVAPPDGQKQKEEAATDSEWEEARREVYGLAPEEKGVGAAEPYSQQRVDELTTSLLEALKNAANIRGLEPENYITLCVFGGERPNHSRFSVLRSGTGYPNVYGSVGQNLEGLTDGGPAGVSQTTLTIRVKKADADAFAKGRLSTDQFRQKAQITAYLGVPQSAGMATGVIETGGRKK